MPGYKALILAGGRSSRLGGSPKALLSDGKQTLLASTLAAVEPAVARAVVGPPDLPLPADVLLTRETPAFSGPAAGITAGLQVLAGAPAPWTLILSVDVPQVAGAVSALVSAAAEAQEHQLGFWGLAEGIYQPLLGIYRTDALVPAFSGDTANASVRRFLAPLNPQPVELAPAHARDVDTWEQARASGFDRAHPAPPSNQP